MSYAMQVLEIVSEASSQPSPSAFIRHKCAELRATGEVELERQIRTCWNGIYDILKKTGGDDSDASNAGQFQSLLQRAAPVED